jgi:hypothetical protein
MIALIGRHIHLTSLQLLACLQCIALGACRTSVYTATAKDEPSSPCGTGGEERLIRILGPTNDFMPTCAHWCNYSSKLLVSSLPAW